MSEMFEKFTAVSQPCKIVCPRDASKAQGCSSDVCKAHSHAGYDVPDMFAKLTAMNDRMSQRCLKRSQSCRINIPEMIEKFAAM